MAKNKKNKSKFRKKLLHKYRMVILNEDTFEERYSLKLTRLNVFVLVMTSAIVLIVATTFIIAFTPLREYIPGYSSPKLKEQAANLAYKTDSLQNVLQLNNQYLNSIKNVLTGEIETKDLNRDSIIKYSKNNPEVEAIAPSKTDSILRQEVAMEDKYNILPSATDQLDFSLFPPVKGSITDSFNLEEKHYAIDVVVAKNSPIKSVADGRVIFSEWTTETGYVIIVKHSFGLLSVYKHNASLLKEEGDFVKAGEVIATAGSTGEYSTGTHLHFELWKEQNPVNPTDYIDFE